MHWRGSNWTYNGHCYARFDNVPMAWPNAQAFCAGWGGYLAVITSSGENNYIQANIAGSSSPFIGGGDFGTNNVWVWINRESFSYTNWSASEPSGDGGCIQMYPSGAWNDLACTTVLTFICESE